MVTLVTPQVECVCRTSLLPQFLKLFLLSVTPMPGPSKLVVQDVDWAWVGRWGSYPLGDMRQINSTVMPKAFSHVKNFFKHTTEERIYIHTSLSSILPLAFHQACFISSLAISWSFPQRPLFF